MGLLFGFGAGEETVFTAFNDPFITNGRFLFLFFVLLYVLFLWFFMLVSLKAGSLIILYVQLDDSFRDSRQLLFSPVITDRFDRALYISFSRLLLYCLIDGQIALPLLILQLSLFFFLDVEQLLSQGSLIAFSKIPGKEKFRSD
jgi:hypothetical protein